jgi:hypothetical protein
MLAWRAVCVGGTPEGGFTAAGRPAIERVGSRMHATSHGLRARSLRRAAVRRWAQSVQQTGGLARHIMSTSLLGDSGRARSLSHTARTVIGTAGEVQEVADVDEATIEIDRPPGGGVVGEP